ncbi:MAG: hypothetical protein R3E79_38040 [Caldilineaceae bacterium]
MTQPTLLRRADAPLESTWNREAVYASWAAWDADYEQALAELPALHAFAGRLGEGPAVLLDWLQTDGLHGGRRLKLHIFAHMAVAVDTTDQAAKSHLSQATALLGKTAAATAFAEPELIQLGETLLAWANAEPQLAPYKHYFANLIRQQAHQHSAEVEEILGLLTDPFSGASATYNELTNTDFRAADAVDSQGRRYPVRNALPAPTGIQSAKGNQPDKVDTDGKHKPSNAVSIIEMSGFEIETVSFESAIEFFGPHANGIQTDQRAVIGAIGEEQPGILFAFGPVNGQPVGTRGMLGGEFDPADAAGCAWLHGKLA